MAENSPRLMKRREMKYSINLSVKIPMKYLYDCEEKSRREIENYGCTMKEEKLGTAASEGNAEI